jgi:hypothetical protein
VKIQNRTTRRRNGQAMLRVVFGLGSVTAGVLAYLLSEVSQIEAVVLPGMVMGLGFFGLAIYGRARSRQDWSAAWDAYANTQAHRESVDARVDPEILSCAGAN